MLEGQVYQDHRQPGSRLSGDAQNAVSNCTAQCPCRLPFRPAFRASRLSLLVARQCVQSEAFETTLYWRPNCIEIVSIAVWLYLTSLTHLPQTGCRSALCLYDSNKMSHSAVDQQHRGQSVRRFPLWWRASFCWSLSRREDSPYLGKVVKVGEFVFTKWDRAFNYLQIWISPISKRQ